MAQNKSLKKAGAGLKQYGMMIMLIVVYLLFAIITKGKNLTPMNINNLIMQNGYVVILAVGMLLCSSWPWASTSSACARRFPCASSA